MIHVKHLQCLTHRYQLLDDSYYDYDGDYNNDIYPTTVH